MTQLLVLVAVLAVFSGIGPIAARTQLVQPSWRVRIGFLSVVGTGLSIVSLLVGVLFPESLGARGFTDLWHRCAEAFRALVADPLDRMTALVAGVALAVFLARFLWALATGARATRRARVRGGQPAWTLGRRTTVHVLPIDEPAAYSVAGLRRQVVVSRGLMAVLDDEERRAVVLHERAHLEGRHHALILVAGAVDAALFKLPPTAAAVAFLRQSIEESADDVAARSLGSPAVVASGLSKAALAGIRSPASAIALGRGPDVPARVRRLLADRRVPGWVGSTCLASVASLLGLIVLTQAIGGLAWLSVVHHVLGVGGAATCPLSA